MLPLDGSPTFAGFVGVVAQARRPARPLASADRRHGTNPQRPGPLRPGPLRPGPLRPGSQWPTPAWTGIWAAAAGIRAHASVATPGGQSGAAPGLSGTATPGLSGAAPTGLR